MSARPAAEGAGPERPTVLLLDVHALVHRAHHALPPMNTASGEPTAALYGTAALLCKLLRERRPHAIGLAFDAGNRRRRALEPTYKHRRQPPAPELAHQLTRVRELAGVLGTAPLAVEGEEADDVLATVARERVAAGDRVLVVTGDRDLLQLVGDDLQVVFIGWRGGPHVDYDEATVRARFGVAPAALPALRAFLGDPADDLPGVTGIGPKTASRWVVAHGDVAGILRNLDALTPARLRPVVAASADQLRRVEALSRLYDHLELPPEPHVARWSADVRGRLDAWFATLEFGSLRARLPPAP